MLTTSHRILYTRIGNSALLNVTVVSSSIITISYWVGKITIVNSNKYTIDNYDLTIGNVNANDDGDYTFYATNMYGTQSISINLKAGSTYDML